MKVHLCCGDVYLLDYLNVDGYGDLLNSKEQNPNITTLDNYYTKSLNEYTKPIIDMKFDLVKDWPFEDNTIDEFLMICGIEHLSKTSASIVIDNVYKSLSVGGKFRFDFPDILETVEVYREFPEYMMRLIYGSGKNEFGFHRWGYTEKTIVDELRNNNWSNIEFKDIVKHDYPMIGVEATK